MADYPIENLLPKAGGSIYRLVRLASHRALELLDGKPGLITNPSSDKVTTMALEEISKGRVEIRKGSNGHPAEKKS